jgi:hypothetical protein
MYLNFDITSLANVLAWPVIVGTIFIIYRKDIGKFLRDISPHVSKFSVGPLSIEFAKVKGFEPQWSGPGPYDFRQDSIVPISSDSKSVLLDQIQERRIIDYAIFDLGDGNQWLSSRLYLFTRIFYMMCRIRCIVFVDQHQEIRNHFVGVADPIQIQNTLSDLFPWLEEAFANVYTTHPFAKKTSSNNNQTLEQFVIQFIKKITDPSKFPVPSESSYSPVKKISQDGWAYLKKTNALENTWEHAEWLDTKKIDELFREVLNKSFIGKMDMITKSNEEQTKMILRTDGNFVAILDQNQRFEKLIDRQKLSNETARNLLVK